MPRPTPDPLARLDFRLDCDCSGDAKVMLVYHPVDHCNGSRFDKVVQLGCQGCAEKRVRWLQDFALDEFLGLRPDHCTSCGLTIVSLRAILVSLDLLNPPEE